MTGDQDDFGFGRAGLDVVQQLETGDVREPAVDDREIHRPGLAEPGEGVLAAVDPVDVMAVLAQHVAHGLPDDRVIVDDEDIGAGCHARRNVHGKCHPPESVIFTDGSGSTGAPG